MSTAIDSLDIQIRSSSGSAAANIDRLARSLQGLRDNSKLTMVTNNRPGWQDHWGNFRTLPRGLTAWRNPK